MSEYENFIKELGVMAKALPGQDPAPTNPPTNEGGDGTPAAAPSTPEVEGQEEPFGKSLEVVLPDGTKTEAFDGTEMMKALWAENAGLKSLVVAHQQALVAVGGQVAATNTLVKSLQADVQRIGSQPAPRMAALTVHDRPSTQPAAPKAPTRGELMAKAETAQRMGKLTPTDLARVEVYLNEGQALPQDLASVIGSVG